MQIKLKKTNTTIDFTINGLYMLRFGPATLIQLDGLWLFDGQMFIPQFTDMVVCMDADYVGEYCVCVEKVVPLVPSRALEEALISEREYFKLLRQIGQHLGVTVGIDVGVTELPERVELLLAKSVKSENEQRRQLIKALGFSDHYLNFEGLCARVTEMRAHENQLILHCAELEEQVAQLNEDNDLKLTHDFLNELADLTRKLLKISYVHTGVKGVHPAQKELMKALGEKLSVDLPHL